MGGGLGAGMGRREDHLGQGRVKVETAEWLLLSWWKLLLVISSSRCGSSSYYCFWVGVLRDQKLLSVAAGVAVAAPAAGASATAAEALATTVSAATAWGGDGPMGGRLGTGMGRSSYYRRLEATSLCLSIC